MILNIVPLRTPLEIYDTVINEIKVFPNARLSKVQESPLYVDLELNSEIPPIHITSCVSKFHFWEALYKLAIDQLNTLYNPELVLQPLDPSRFSINAPLFDWISFQRVFYIRQGKSCENVIKAYLESPSATVPEELRALGFAPDQVEKHLTDDVIRYFRKSIEGLQVNDFKIINLRKRYPNITDHIANTLIKEQLAKPIENKYECILRQLQNRVVGQKHAVEKMASALDCMLEGDNSVFLFVGPTGVGKTELAKAAASLKNNHLISINMNEFSESHTVSSFFGSPPGYRGSSSKPQLAMQLEKYQDAVTHIDGSNIVISNVVLLFDELEKAHSEVRQSLLQLFDEGTFKIRYTVFGENVNIQYTLKNSVIIGTSNLCQDIILTAFQQCLSTDKIVEAFKVGNKQLQKRSHEISYSDELLARFSVIPFGPIPRGVSYRHLLEIRLNIFFSEAQKAIKCREINIEDKPSVLKILEEKLYGNGTDIRKVNTYCKSILTKINQNKRHWGDIKQVKMILIPSDNKKELALKISIFSPLAYKYIEIHGVGPYLI